MREQYRQILGEIKAEVVSILADLEVTVQEAARALLEGDYELATRIVAGDDEYDRRTLAVEDRVLETIATQFPVARDLRLLHSMAFIAMYEERMADLAANVAKTALRVTDKKGTVRAPQALADLISQQSELVAEVLKTTREALETSSLELALKLPELDAPIDSLYKQFFRELAHLTDEKEIEWASRMVMSSRYLERISDNAVDIGERVVFLITGERDAYDEIELSAEGQHG
ncbi:MAG: phosphate signaling complex protein PhoU [Actinomycetia bacterium]|nr:phosphate signaling complex protein PhoU [Actinomycetes bacterium]